MFSKAGGISVAVIPKRDLAAELKWALWAYWFQLRILTVAGRVFGQDFESYSDSLVQIFGGRMTLETCVLCRESAPAAHGTADVDS